ncbi:bifunctional tetrahydrofolate synthase/dihydrofolate synthase [Niveibacterium terrae]|uniref:bifunctional tetrahydrofolate synthase/dihydrofolate synthase n=1 Tax=Niveibacterium terrae TaxID=3373598 RepID=UPI003A936A97
MKLPDTLPGWLEYIERQHSKTIALGLARVQKVADALAARPDFPVILVGGTNGKGSTCALLEAILIAAGYRVGLYTSPHLIRYNERVRVDGSEVSDEALVRAFAEVEAARGDTPLTYFEYGTLAAWALFARASLDVVILEVGMGGRLDAVNVFEPDLAIVTSVALDHMDFLGDTREAIGFEKAGIYRAARPALCADPEPPKSLVDHALAIGADLRLIDRDFGFEQSAGRWNWRGRAMRLDDLPPPALKGQVQYLNASVVLAALEALQQRLPVPEQAIREALTRVRLPGRFQILGEHPQIVLDVAHNPQAALSLARNLSAASAVKESWAVLGMLADKDVEGVIRAVEPQIDHWVLCSLPGPRGLTAESLRERVLRAGVRGDIDLAGSPTDALARCRERAGVDDRIAVFGSFLTVTDVLAGTDAEGSSNG